MGELLTYFVTAATGRHCTAIGEFATHTLSSDSGFSANGTVNGWTYAWAVPLGHNKAAAEQQTD